MALQIGNYFREIGPFIIFGAAAAAAHVTIFGRSASPWTGTRLIAPIAAIPLGIIPFAVSAIRSVLIQQTSSREEDAAARERGILRRAFSYVEDLVFPFAISAAIGAVIVVMTPTEPLWAMLSGDSPWRLVIAPLIAGIVKPRGGTELPLIMALITKGLDPAGVVAGIAGAAYLHARSVPLALAHLAFGVAMGGLFWLTGFTW